MRVLPALLASTALVGGCATPMAPAPDGPPMADNGNDCAVIAAIAKEHYRFNTTDNRPPPIRFEGDFAPRCDWSRHGLGAVVETGIMHGPLAGMGYECRVISGFAGWTVPEGACRNTWVS
jgi:hypothetical protein